jgi:hypothetical protein
MGEVPNPLDTPSGCAFHPRCPYAMPECRQTAPPLHEVEPDRWVACYLYPDNTSRQAPLATLSNAEEARVSAAEPLGHALRRSSP